MTGRAAPAGRLRRAVRRCVAAILFGGLGLTTALAYVQLNHVDRGFVDVGLYQSGAFVLRLEQDASFRITDGSDLTALRDAMTRWTSIATSDAVISEGALFDLPSPIDVSAGLATAGNRMFFAETDTSNRIGSAIAVSFYTFGASGAISDCDIVMNERLYTFSTTTPANPNQVLGSSTYDIGEIATHEMGHCLGMEHSPVAGAFSASTGLEVSGFTSADFTYQATMYPYGTRTIQGRSLSDDDIDGVSFIYPNTTLNTTRATISGRVLNGATFAPVKGAHVVAVTTAAPNIPVASVISDVQAGGLGGEFNIRGLPPGSYYIRIEPLIGTSNPFTQANTNFTGFVTSFPWEFYDGATESGFDAQTAKTAITVVAGQTVSGINIFTNVGAPDPNEPNNTLAAATPIACSAPMSASIVPINDVDYFALSVAYPTVVHVDVNASRSGSSLDPEAAVYDGLGNQMAFADNTASLDPLLNLTLPAMGTYYIAVASFDDPDFNGSGGATAGSYTVTVTCSVPPVPAGTCPGKLLFAGTDSSHAVLVLADVDHDLRFDGQNSFWLLAGNDQGTLGTRRDGGVLVAHLLGSVSAYWDDNGDIAADRTISMTAPVADSGALATFRRSGAEYIYAGGLLDGGTVQEMRDDNGDLLPERTTNFSEFPVSVYALSVDEGGTVYVLDPYINQEQGALLALRDLDGDGVADVETIFEGVVTGYAAIAGRRPGELFAVDVNLGKIDRLIDINGDGQADSVTPYATGLALSVNTGITFDAADVLYVVVGDNQVVALPDDDGDGDADRVVPFSPLISGLRGLAFGIGPPQETSAPGSYVPLSVAPLAGGQLRLRWEDLGATVPSYNVYEGTLGGGFAPASLACHVTGTPDGNGGRTFDITPGAGSRYYVVTASDACGEGSAGRSSAGPRRTLPAPACGAAP